MRRKIWKPLAIPTLATAVAAIVVAPLSSTADVRPGVQLRSPINELIHQHHCWVRKAPDDMQGEIPGHVVVTLPGETTPTYSAEHVGPALRHVVNGQHRRLRVHAFCR